MTRRRIAEHLRIGNTADGHYAVLCQHCGAVFVPSLPVSLGMLEAILNQFAREHRSCKAPATGPIDEAMLLARANVKGLLVR